jgi:hypothetical protein
VDVLDVDISDVCSVSSEDERRKELAREERKYVNKGVALNIYELVGNSRRSKYLLDHSSSLTH